MISAGIYSAVFYNIILRGVFFFLPRVYTVCGMPSVLYEEVALHDEYYIYVDDVVSFQPYLYRRATFVSCCARAILDDTLNLKMYIISFYPFL